MRCAIILLLLFVTAAYGQEALPPTASSPETASGKTPLGQPVSANGRCSGFHWGDLQTRYWSAFQPEDLQAPGAPAAPATETTASKPANPRTVWIVRTDLGDWQPVPKDAVVSQPFNFPFIVYALEKRGAMHIGCFNP